MDNITRRIDATISATLSETTPITHNFSKTSYYYLCDLYEKSKQKVDVSINEFLTILTRLENIVVVKNPKVEFSLVCLKNDHDESVVDKILNREKSGEKMNESVFSDDDWSDECKVGDKPIEELKKDVYSQPCDEIFDLLSDDNSVEEKEKKCEESVKKKNKSSVGKDVYDLSSDEGFSNAEIVKNKKPAIKKQHVNKNPTKNHKTDNGFFYNNYQAISKMLIDAFQSSLIIPTTSLNLAVIEIKGVGFNYKQSVCKTGRHPHATLSKYISCCDDILELLRFKNIYIKRIDQKSKIMIENRKNVHFMNLSGPNYKYHLEILIVNMFPIKVTVPFSDLLEIFKNIYGVGIDSICTQTPMTLISSIESPNMYFTKINELMITCIPTCSSEYKEYGDINELNRVHDLARSESKIKVISEKKEVVEKNIEVKSLPVKISTLFNDKLFVGLASENIPKDIQTQNVDCGALSVFKHFESDLLLNPEWMFVAQNLKMDGKPTFFVVQH